VPLPAPLSAKPHVQLPMEAVGCQPSLVELGKTRSAPLPSMEDPEDSAKLQPLVRTRTISAVSTDSCVSALSSSTVFWSPSSHFTPKSSVYPPGMGLTPLAASQVHRTLTPSASPIERTISMSSEASLVRTTSISRPYPPGLGYTPISTPKDSLSRANSFGLNAEVEPCRARRKSTTDLTAVLEAHAEDHSFSRELLLLFRSEPGEGDDPADAGFLLPAPGFFRMQAVHDASPKALAEQAPRAVKAAAVKAKPAQAQAANGKGKGSSDPSGKGKAAHSEASQAPAAGHVPPKGPAVAPQGSKGAQAPRQGAYAMKGQNWHGKGAWAPWGPKGGWSMWPGQKGGWY